MDYEKAYKKALERAKKNYDVAQDLCNGSQIGVECFKNTLTNIFPELKESEDERIRKRLIDLIYKVYAFTNYITCVEYENIIAWLEKQEHIDENKLAKGVLSGVANSIMQWLDANIAEGNMCLSNMECKDIENSVRNADWNKVYRYMKKKLEKQGEQRPIIPKFRVGDVITDGKEFPHCTIEEIDEQVYYCDYTNIDIIDADKNWKLVEQKSVNNVEPKFKVGDWVVDNHGKVNQITSVTDDGYGFCLYDGTYVSGCWKDYYHLWTIQDAKDGDVLWHSDSASNGVFIFKEIRYDGKVLCYCDYDSEDHFCLGEHHTCCWVNDKYIKPATQEQRYLLFQKMKEAGYEWDAEKKELKKIEKKQEWSEEDKNFMYDTLSNLTELKDRYGDGYGKVRRNNIKGE